MEYLCEGWAKATTASELQKKVNLQNPRVPPATRKPS